MNIIYLFTTLYALIKTLSFAVYMFKSSNYFSFALSILLVMTAVSLVVVYCM